MKKIVSLFLIVALFFSIFGILCVSASEATESLSETLECVKSNCNPAKESEEKIPCDATLDDNFEDDSVIIVLKNNNSRKLNSYTTKSFPEISTASSVKDLTSYTKDRIVSQRNKKAKAKSNIEKELLSSNDEMYVDEERFHQIIKIDIKNKGKENVLKCIKELEARDDVLMAFPNYKYKPANATNDPEYPNDSDWAIEQIQLPEAWNIATNTTTVNVGIIDSGIQGNHEDLTNVVNRTLSKDFTGGNSPLTDEHGHGTAVAGVVGAKANNSIGIAGTCDNVSLVSLKAGVIDSNGDCSISVGRLASAVDYAIKNNIPILNYSYYGEGSGYEKLKLALENYSGLFVCAAGNDNKDITTITIPKFEYNKNNTVVVAGSDEDDKLYYYLTNNNKEVGSNYSVTKVHLAAPGYKIGTTSSTTQSGYDIAYGTSIAAPFVTGVAALLKSKYPDMSGQTMKYYIEAGVDKIDALEGKVATGGRLNAYNTLNGVKTFDIVYNANGGSGNMDNTTVIYNNTTPLSANKFTYTGAEFAGWCAYRESDKRWYYTNGTTKKWFKDSEVQPGYKKYVYRDLQTLSKTSSVDDDTVIMYAQWDYDCTINFNANTGSGTMASTTVNLTKSTTLPANTFTKTGYRFDHWYVKNEGGETFCYSGPETDWYMLSELPYGYYREKLSGSATINKDVITGLTHGDSITLYAYWEPITATLGDVNKDGYITSADANLVRQYLANAVVLSPSQIYIADVNYSGTITIKDATNIEKYVIGELDYFID